MPEGRGEKRNHPDKSEFVTPLVEGNPPLIPLCGGVPEGRGWRKETTPTYQNMPPLYRGEFTSYSPQRRGARRAGWRVKKPPRQVRTCHPSIE